MCIAENHSRDPFERSMAFWLIKEYAQAASTLVEEASKDNFLQSDVVIEHSLSDIFNFYSYLRRHPLVVFLWNFILLRTFYDIY